MVKVLVPADSAADHASTIRSSVDAGLVDPVIKVRPLTEEEFIQVNTVETRDNYKESRSIPIGGPRDDDDDLYDDDYDDDDDDDFDDDLDEDDDDDDLDFDDDDDPDFDFDDDFDDDDDDDTDYL